MSYQSSFAKKIRPLRPNTPAPGREKHETDPSGSSVSRCARIGVCRKERVVTVVLPAPIHAALVFIADANQGLGICYRQVMEQDGIDQGENGRVDADAEREREQHG